MVARPTARMASLPGGERDPFARAAVDAFTYGRGAVETRRDGTVVHLSTADIDRMADAMHRETDPGFYARADREQHDPIRGRETGAFMVEGSFYPYAPDPDMDYQRGRDDGFDQGYRARVNEELIVQWFERPSIGWRDLIMSALCGGAIGVLIWLGSQP